MSSDSPTLPPPIYAQEAAVSPEIAPQSEPQILIMPATDSLRFQQGFLGADGERAAIEGELQIKGTDSVRWRKVTMDLRTVEVAYDQVIELSQSSIVLHASEDDTGALLPSSFPFALPLTPDTPQCIHTPQSSLRHILSATLQPFDDTAQPFSKELTVHTRRFISHTRSIPISPVTRALDNPARVEVEIPRTVFTCVEPVPIYVTVPPPSRELVVEGGLRLRNVKAELIRIVRVADGAETDESESVNVDIPSDIDDESEEEGDHGASAPLGISLPSHEKHAAASSSSAHYPGDLPQCRSARYRTVISRSGALCRFHASLPVRLRFMLHQSSPSSSPSDSIHPLPAGDFGSTGSDAECASITQTTLLHSVSFRIRVHATFRNTSHHTERVSTITIPITFLPSPAPLPEVEESVSSAYHKKHDRPPARTNRPDDVDAAPHYEGEAGPSYLASGLPSGLPPPFEERDAPPPFFPSSSSRLPTFLESEQEIFMPDAEDDAAPPPALIPPVERVIEGEGILFGFPASSQFSGHTEVDRNGAPTPPPPVEMATLDPNVTGLVRMNVDVPEHTIQTLGLTLHHQQEEITAGEAPPPPPPPMDDPSDPPPSIHSEYRSREGVAHQATTIAVPPANRPAPQMAPGIPVSTRSHVSAPPPYLVPDGTEHEHVARPPPYVDLMPPPHNG